MGIQNRIALFVASYVLLTQSPARADEGKTLSEAGYLHAVGLCRIQKGEAPAAVQASLLSTAAQWGIPAALMTDPVESSGPEILGKLLLKYLGTTCSNPAITPKQWATANQEATRVMNADAERIERGNAQKEVELKCGRYELLRNESVLAIPLGPGGYENRRAVYESFNRAAPQGCVLRPLFLGS